MSYSFREPEWPDVCGCKYDETRDEMDREDCPFHSDLVEEKTAADGVFITKRKRPGQRGDVKEPAA